MLDALGTMLNGDSIELLSASGQVFAVLKLSNPATKAAAGGELEFNRIGEEDAGLAQGQPRTARILSSDGGEVFLCDVGDKNSEAVIKLKDAQINRSGPVRINSFRLSMP